MQGATRECVAARGPHQLAVHAAVLRGRGKKLVEAIHRLLVAAARHGWVGLAFHRRVHMLAGLLVHPERVRHCAPPRL